ncbi:MAG TPA: DUF4258 domain-containing protein [Desulfuromonadales bacterium]|nr:DUF4258 domain-containing protein [Desulfuromonadales bacterium]
MATAFECNEYDSMPRLSRHAGSRMGSRRISQDDVATVMSYGRTYHVRGAVIYALGRREAEVCRTDGLHPDRIEGLQVVCAPQDNTVITVYRNNDFSSLKRRNTRRAP